MSSLLIRRLSVSATKLAKHFRISIRAAVILFFLFATVVTASVAVSLQYFFSKKLAAESTLQIYEKTAKNIQTRIDDIDKSASYTVKLLSQTISLSNLSQITADKRQLLSDALLTNSLSSSLHIGFNNGDYYEISNLKISPALRRNLDATTEDSWVVSKVSGQGKSRKKTVQYYDDNFKLRTTVTEPTKFDPRNRPWFLNSSSEKVHKSSPHLFQITQIAGNTYSIKLAKNNTVIALDITRAALDKFLKKQVDDTSTEIYLYQKNGELIASNNVLSQKDTLPAPPAFDMTDEQKELVKGIPYLLVSNETDWAPINFSASGTPYGYAVDTLNYISQMTGIKIHYVNGSSWRVMAEMFFNRDLDVLQPLFDEPTRRLFGRLTAPFLDVTYGILTAKSSERIDDLDGLKGKKVAIPEGWLLASKLEEQLPETQIIQVSNVRGMFDAVETGKADAAIDTMAVLTYTVKQFFIDDVNITPVRNFDGVELPTQLHFMLHRSDEKLTALFNEALSKLGPEYIEAMDDKWLRSTRERNYQLGAVPYQKLLQMAQHDLPSGLNIIDIGDKSYFVYMKVFSLYNDKTDILAILAPVDTIFASAISRVKTSILLSALALLCLLPLSWLLANPFVGPVRRLAEESRKITQRDYANVTKVSTKIIELKGLVNSMMDMSKSIQKHEKAQQDLLDAMIKVIAQAIDDKSPHTAGHCERVPELAFMLMHEVEKSESGSFKNFHFNSPEEWREFQVAAWLHDCGKITTPEHIIDKGTKLESLYNRIHEIRMRFEVLWRDAEIEFLLSKLSSDNPDVDEEKLLLVKQQKQQQLQDDFAFIARANIGGEFMSDEDIARLEQLSKRTWQRFFDDRQGLSHIELNRYNAQAQPLPATEYLLADKKEHIIERVSGTEFDEKFGIKMTVPESLYNLGELYNLSIKKGTLTAEDRFKINEHIISTIKMLESLPLPKELQRVPRYASTHHETALGTGYPRQLMGNELSIPERVMVLADIYEALTAADRPYKKAMPISQALRILNEMKETGHIDPEVFKLFLKSGVYLQYAKRFLPAQQIDKVDVSQYLNDD